MVIGIVRVGGGLVLAVGVADQITLSVVSVGLRIAGWIGDLRDTTGTVARERDALTGRVNDAGGIDGKSVVVWVPDAAHPEMLIDHIRGSLGGGQTESTRVKDI